jgi:hypothetical protein
VLEAADDYDNYYDYHDHDHNDNNDVDVDYVHQEASAGVGLLPPRLVQQEEVAGDQEARWFGPGRRFEEEVVFVWAAVCGVEWWGAYGG